MIEHGSKTESIVSQQLLTFSKKELLKLIFSNFKEFVYEVHMLQANYSYINKLFESSIQRVDWGFLSYLFFFF